MCQAYEGEARFYRAIGGMASQRGFEDKLNGKPMNYDGSMWREDYGHGYRCAEEGILPCSVEDALGLDDYDAKFICPACGKKVSRYSRKKDGADHDFGFPCDGSNPLEHQRRDLRRQQYEALKKEFGDVDNSNSR